MTPQGPLTRSYGSMAQRGEVWEQDGRRGQCSRVRTRTSTRFVSGNAEVDELCDSDWELESESEFGLGDEDGDSLSGDGTGGLEGEVRLT